MSGFVLPVDEAGALLLRRDHAEKGDNLDSTLFIVVGGGMISYASFLGGLGHRFAEVGGVILACGVLLLVLANFRRWRAG